MTFFTAAKGDTSSGDRYTIVVNRNSDTKLVTEIIKILILYTQTT